MSTSSRTVVRWRSSVGKRRASDELATEEPLEIRADGFSLGITMRSPGHDEELAAGLMAGEGVITERKQVQAIKHYPRNKEGNVIDVFLALDAKADLKRLTRQRLSASSCGICGRTQVQQGGRKLRAQKDLIFSTATIAALPELLSRSQPDFAKSGGLHGAGIFDERGKLIVAREDIGRHNAVDKVLGYAFLNELSLERTVLVVSGRASFEIVSKAVNLKVPVLVAVSAPSQLAVDLARRCGQTLIGFARGDRFNIYSGRQRIGL